MSEQLPCLTPGCKNTVLPSKAKRTGGYCGPCAGRRAEAAREEFLRGKRRDVDLYAGVTDPVEMLRIMHQDREHDPLVNLLPPPKTFEELYTQLTHDNAVRMMRLAADALPQGDIGFAEEIAGHLAAFTDYSLDTMLETWLEHHHFWPSLAFRGAGGAMAKAIIRAIEVGSANPSEALGALAWIRSDEVLRFLIDAEISHPAWTTQLRVSPAMYARDAGWEIAQGHQRDLFFRTCLALTPGPEGAKPDDAVHIMEEVEDRCPFCQRPLVALIRLDLSDPRFSFLEVKGSRLDVLACDMCTCFYSIVFAELEEEGRGLWASHNQRSDLLPSGASDWYRNPWTGVPVRLSPRRIHHAADWTLPTSLSQIGGIPAWVQQPAYPDCPTCGQTMLFLAQVDNAQFSGYEGVYYAFVCPHCRVTATTYQQT